jgi:uncharacterized protein YjiS (DUF1127 family)
MMTTYTEKCNRGTTATTAGLLQNLVRLTRHWLDNQLLGIRLQQERQALLAMSEAQLKDIGISRAEAEQEAGRSDVPTTRCI